MIKLGTVVRVKGLTTWLGVVVKIVLALGKNLEEELPPKYTVEPLLDEPGKQGEYTEADLEIQK